MRRRRASITAVLVALIALVLFAAFLLAVTVAIVGGGH
jgi:hypothetical protein